jgi:hypothetical protein
MLRIQSRCCPARRLAASSSVRGQVGYAGVNDLSLSPLNVISLIGLPLTLLAVVMEEIHRVRQRRFDRGRGTRRAPALRLGSAG